MGSGIPFANNWAYLDTELSWLERLLLVAVSQQRKNLKSVTRVAKTSSDKATSDWWQGLVAIKNRAYDDAAPQKVSSDKPALGYQKTLDTRVLLSRARKISLGLPTMQAVLGLSLFEKKLVLMALAPEVQMRYGKLYHYLQTGKNCTTGSLPTLELALRVLCRNDAERRRARTRLSRNHVLLQRQVLRPVDDANTLMGAQLQLAPEWVDYLLSEQPDPMWPLQFIPADRLVPRCRERFLWSDLVLAEATKQQLETVTLQGRSRLLLVGEKGVGKERIAIALSTHLKQPLHIVDLGQLSPQNWAACLSELDQFKCPMVLIKAAHHWLGRHADVERAALQHWLNNMSGHVIFSVRHRHLVRCHWRQQLTVVDIPMPDADMRLQLWQQSFPTGVKGVGKARWASLAEELVLSSEQIEQIVSLSKKLDENHEVTLEHLKQAILTNGHNWQPR